MSLEEMRRRLSGDGGMDYVEGDSAGRSGGWHRPDVRVYPSRYVGTTPVAYRRTYTVAGARPYLVDLR